LLTELKTEKNFSSLLRLLGIPGKDAPAYVRTVGLRDALVRVEKFVISPASRADLFTLVDMRDGSIHAAHNEEVEVRLVLAFIQHADALLEDLKRPRDRFWGDQTEVVDALLADATDKTAYHVSVKMAAARAEYDKFVGRAPFELQGLIPRLLDYHESEIDEELIECPACDSPAIAEGYHDVEWVGEDDAGHKEGYVWFDAYRVRCAVCKLELDGPEIPVVMNRRWKVENADPFEWESLLSNSE